MTVDDAKLIEQARREPLGVDISDYSDEFCAGFLAGQAHILEEIAAERIAPDAVQRLTAERDEAREWYSQARHGEDEAVAVLTVTRKQCAARVRDLEADRDRLAAALGLAESYIPVARLEAYRERRAALAAVAQENGE